MRLRFSTKSKHWLFLLLTATTLVETVGAHAENPYPVADHIWVIGVDSHHPVGVAWDRPAGAGIHSYIHIDLCIGMQHPIEIDLPVVVLGLLVFAVIAVLVFGLSRRFKHPRRPNHEPGLNSSAGRKSEPSPKT